MTWTDVIIILIVAAVLVAAAVYVVKEKKKGTRCVGCPYAGECAKRNCTGEAAIQEE